MMKVRVKNLTSHTEFDACLEIQKKVWRHREADLTPTHHFCIGQETGAILLGAYSGNDLVGFAYSFPSVSRGKLGQHSHLLAVLPRFQGYGIGKVLKWAQREEALRRGYDLITWTFDPLRVRNANLNLHALGGLTRVYLPNFYGLTPSLLLAPRVPSDRLKVEWPLKDKRVEKRQRQEWDSYDLRALPRALEGRDVNRVRQPGSVGRPSGAPLVLAEIPARIRDLRSTPELVTGWQTALRRALTQHFSLGYVAVDFILGERCYYVLRRGKEKSR